MKTPRPPPSTRRPLLGSTLLPTVLLAGCGDTWRGLEKGTGENLEKTGRAIEKASRKVENGSAPARPSGDCAARPRSSPWWFAAGGRTRIGATRLRGHPIG